MTTARAGDAEFFTDAFGRLERGAVDYTNFFRALSSVASSTASNAEGQTPNAAETAFIELFTDAEDGRSMLAAYRLRLEAETRLDAERQSAMLVVNPKYVLRNYLAEQAIRAAQQRDYTELARLHDVLRRPFDDQLDREAYANAPPDWARTLSVSCSS